MAHLRRVPGGGANPWRSRSDSSWADARPDVSSTMRSAAKVISASRSWSRRMEQSCVRQHGILQQGMQRSLRPSDRQVCRHRHDDGRAARRRASGTGVTPLCDARWRADHRRRRRRAPALVRLRHGARVRRLRGHHAAVRRVAASGVGRPTTSPSGASSYRWTSSSNACAARRKSSRLSNRSTSNA
jgi:hypothetical protein